jgi:hypothetical protein
VVVELSTVNEDWRYLNALSPFLPDVLFDFSSLKLTIRKKKKKEGGLIWNQ